MPTKTRNPGSLRGQYTPTRGRYQGRTFSSYRAYKDALAQEAGYASERARLAHGKNQKSTGPSRGRALQGLSYLRKGKSLSEAARMAGTTPETIRRYVSPALTRTSGGRIKAKPYDRLTRTMRVITENGVEIVEIKDSRTASRVAEYDNAVQRFLATGDATVLHQFRNASFVSGGRRVRFISDPNILEELAFTGNISFESIYAEAT